MRYATPRTPALPRLLLLGAIGSVLAACASSSSARREATPASRYVISAGELANAGAETLYDAVLKLRPEYIRGRGEVNRVQKIPMPVTQMGTGTGAGGSTAGKADAPDATPAPEVIVYRDGDRIGSVNEMRHLLISQVAEVRYMPGPEAAVKFGTNHGGGVILITSKPAVER